MSIGRVQQISAGARSSGWELTRCASPFLPTAKAGGFTETFDEVDRPETLALGEGMAVLVAPGNVPVFFDHEGVNQVIGDLSGRGTEAT